MQDKRTFKVLAPITKQDGTTYWLRCGSGHLNRDSSINVYLDAMPREFKLTLRELDDEDLRRRDAYRANQAAALPPLPPPADDLRQPITIA